MYINKISHQNNLYINKSQTNPQFKSLKPTSGSMSRFLSSGPIKPFFLTAAAFVTLSTGTVCCNNNSNQTNQTNQTEEIPVKEIKTEEIAKYPNLNPVKLQSVIDMSESILESYYNTEFTYAGIIYNNRNFEIQYSSPKYEKQYGNPKTISYNPSKNYFYAVPDGEIELINEVDGTYILNHDGLNFEHTSNGELKKLPSTKSKDKKNIILSYSKKNKELMTKTLNAKVDQSKLEKESQDEIEYIKSIPILKGVDPHAVKRLTKAMNYDIDYGGNILFLDGKGVGWRLNVKPTVTQPDRAIFIGIANEMTDKGGSKNYLIKLEMTTSPKADRIVISKLEVEQDGVEDDSPTHKKIDGTVQIEKTQSGTTKKHNLKGGGAGGGLGVPLGNVLLGIGGGGFGANLTTDELSQINKVIMSVYPKMVTRKEIIYNKRTGIVAIIGEYMHANQ